jgi:hypothetical protein
MIRMPLERLPPGSLRRLVIPLVVLWALAWLPFLFVGEPDQMMRLQFAGSSTEARQVLAAWSPDETVDMGYLLGIDHVHLVAYSLLLALAAIWAGRQFRGRLSRWAPVMAWMPVAAAVFDVAENVGLLQMIRGHTETPVPTFTTVTSFAKYTMALLVLPYVAGGLAARVRRPT